MKNYLFEKGANLFPKVKKASGVCLEGENGKRYIDFASSTFNLSLGYNHPVILEAVRKQMEKACYTSTSFSHDVVLELSEKLVKLCPKNLTKVHPKCTGGSTANEGAIKAALKVTKRDDIVSYYYGYHGQTYLTQAITGYDSQRKCLPGAGFNIIRIPFPYCYRCFFDKKFPQCKLFCLNKISEILDISSNNGPACIIMEPILGIGGCVVPPKRYMKGLERICKERNIPLIIDEVMTGIGRTGKMFGFENFGIKPNMITLAKGLGGSGFGSAALVAEERFTVLDDYEHSFTASNYLIGAAAANATLDIISSPYFLKNVRRLGKILKDRLLNFKNRFDFIGDVRGIGLMQGMEIVKGESPDTARALRIVRKAFDEGLFIRCYKHALTNTILIVPALIITDDELNEGLDIIEKVLIYEQKHEK